MFRKSEKSQQQNLFTSGNSIFSGKSLQFYSDNNQWHNQFREYVTMRIDEGIFKPLYNEDGKGAPNYSIRVLIAMMVLKEAQGISDQKLFEDCRFNLLMRSALGLMDVDSPLPTESTYYLFRKNINDYAKDHDINLFELCFSNLTKNQCNEFDISGKRIRMDSKLMGSNIAWLSRYELVHETLSLFYKQVKGTNALDNEISAKLDEHLKMKGNKVTYIHNQDEVRNRLSELGELIYKILETNQFTSSKHYNTLQRVFNEQFEVTDQGKVNQRPKEQILSTSVQSPHDTDCTYRDKDGNKKKGYSINVTETCNQGDKPNLISDIKVATVNTADTTFLKGAVERTQEIFVDKPKYIHADGAYHNPSNQDFCKKHEMHLYLNAIQGPRGKYAFRYLSDGELEVRIIDTGELINAKMTKGRNGIEKWVIKEGGTYRYFSQKQINNGLIRDNIEETAHEILQIRNNVEASIFQLGYHYPNSKTRYRGIIKHQMWANIRCLWVNFVRISNYLKQVDLLMLNFTGFSFKQIKLTINNALRIFLINLKLTLDVYCANIRFS